MVLLAVLAAITFLIEGAILDWSALLLVDRRLVPKAQGEIGFMLFSIGMSVGRLVGDSGGAARGRPRDTGGRHSDGRRGFRASAGGRRCPLRAGKFPAHWSWCIELGSHSLPEGRHSEVMPAGLAVAAITTVGHAGLLVEPGFAGFLANFAVLPSGFAMLAALMCLVALSARSATIEAR
ncbi:hypothetical protein [Bradyrhizobium sp. USDA 3256]